MKEQPFPILEFDPDPDAVISPADWAGGARLPRRCVLTFFREIVEEKCAAQGLQPLAALRSEIVTLPIYPLEVGGVPVCLAMPFAGSAGAAGALDELAAMGCGTFLICGAAGALQSGLTAGRLILPTAAVRDEGASYHYRPPGREALPDPELVAALERALAARGLPFVTGKTWTTDALYRETRGKIARRAAEGCLTVEMEAAGFFAAASFRGLQAAQLLYAADDVSGEAWAERGWRDQRGVRRALVDLCLETIASL